MLLGKIHHVRVTGRNQETELIQRYATIGTLLQTLDGLIESVEQGASGADQKGFDAERYGHGLILADMRACREEAHDDPVALEAQIRAFNDRLATVRHQSADDRTERIMDIPHRPTIRARVRGDRMPRRQPSVLVQGLTGGLGPTEATPLPADVDATSEVDADVEMPAHVMAQIEGMAAAGGAVVDETDGSLMVPFLAASRGHDDAVSQDDAARLKVRRERWERIQRGIAHAVKQHDRFTTAHAAAAIDPKKPLEVPLSRAEFALHHAHTLEREKELTPEEQSLIHKTRARLKKQKEDIAAAREPFDLRPFARLKVKKPNGAPYSMEEVEEDMQKVTERQSTYEPGPLRDLAAVMEGVFAHYAADLFGKGTRSIGTNAHADNVSGVDFVVSGKGFELAFDTTSAFEYHFVKAKWMRTLIGISGKYQSLGNIKYFEDPTKKGAARYSTKTRLPKIICGLDRQHSVELMHAYNAGEPMPDHIKTLLLASEREQLDAQIRIAESNGRTQALEKLKKTRRTLGAVFKRSLPKDAQFVGEAMMGDASVRMIHQLCANGKRMYSQVLSARGSRDEVLYKEAQVHDETHAARAAIRKQRLEEESATAQPPKEKAVRVAHMTPDMARAAHSFAPRGWRMYQPRTHEPRQKSALATASADETHSPRAGDDWFEQHRVLPADAAIDMSTPSDMGDGMHIFADHLPPRTEHELWYEREAELKHEYNDLLAWLSDFVDHGPKTKAGYTQAITYAQRAQAILSEVERERSRLA
jgi:hypothetical protein